MVVVVLMRDSVPFDWDGVRWIWVLTDFKFKNF